MSKRGLWLLLAWWLLAGCDAGQPVLPTAVVPQVTRVPVATPTLRSTPIEPADSGWINLRTGLEQRQLRLFGEEGQEQEQLLIVRLDPAYFRFEVAYEPGGGRDLLSWQTETGALLVVNGGFFTEENVATGLVVHEGQPSGRSYEGFGGMFAVTDEGPEVRALQVQPYDPQETLSYGLQSFPLLVRPDGQPGYPEEDGQRARRTVVAQDRQGRLLFIVAPWGHFTLYELSRFLAESDLDLAVALNLDGGTSSGLLLVGEEGASLSIPAFSPLPAVIIVHPR